MTRPLAEGDLHKQAGNAILQAFRSGNPPLSALLLKLEQLMKLEGLSLKLFLSSHRPGRMLCGPSYARWEHAKIATSQEQVALNGQIVRAGGLVVVPLPAVASDATPGILLFQGGDAPSTDDSNLSGLALLTSLVLNTEQPTFPSLSGPARKDKGFDEASDLRQLVRVLLPRAWREFQAVAVMLRPVYGRTLLGQPQEKLLPGLGRFASLLRDFEDQHVGLLLRHPEAPLVVPFGRDDSSGLAGGLFLAFPLQQHDRLLGIASLVLLEAGGREGKAVDLADDPRLQELLAEVSAALARLDDDDRMTSLTQEKNKAFRETAILFRISRAMQSTVHLDDLTHLTLSAAAHPSGGDFERAMLFMVNERSQILQGMLAVTRESSRLVFPDDLQGAWVHPTLDAAVRQEQRNFAECRLAMKQRIPLDEFDNPFARAIERGRVVLVSDPGKTADQSEVLLDALRLGPFAVAPLVGRGRIFGLLVLDNPVSRRPIGPDRLRFIELFAGYVGATMKNAMLLNRLEATHRELLHSQEQLIQGEKLAGLGEMAASVAHEMKNPLTIIGGFARRLHESAGDVQQQQDYGEIIWQEVRRMEVLLDDILAFSRKQILCVTECLIPPVLEEALDICAEQIDKGMIRVKAQVDGDLPKIQADPVKLRQVLVNLVTNACHAMDEGGLLLLRVHNGYLRGNRAISIEVEDTGGGIHQDVIRNIFNPFFTTKEGGTGVGLSICHRIIEHHGGTIAVENVPHGARFVISLPLSQNVSPEVDKPESFG
ncbi:MAG: hypothetical protein C0616_08555 [Desulfuromonas sp.]|nr:MAG: hypothetical protein C0616_08555 [Desulfuromonas sp.]